MLRKLTESFLAQMSIKNKIKQKAAQFLTVDAEAVLRTAPTMKQRKYKNIEITEDFKKLDEKRKKQRYQNMKKRQILLQQKLKNQTKLLNASETQLIKAQITEIQKVIKDDAKQIQQLNAVIDSSEAQYMVVERHTKLTVLNHIQYLEYLHKNNPGYTLHPQTIKAIQNIHYCVNHNLPVSRIHLYEIMPQYFQAQIGQLQQSVRKLIQQKQIYLEDEQTKSSIRFFHKIQNDEKDVAFFENQLEQTFYNLEDYCLKLLQPHGELLEKVAKGKTPFRNLHHMRYVMLSDMPINYLPEEEAFRKDLLQIVQLEKEWRNYKSTMNKQILQLAHRYVPPPPYIKNHPLLSQRWEEMMEKVTNPIPIQKTQFLVQGDTRTIQLAQKIQQQIRKIVHQKYDPLFIEAMNNDRSLIDKKKLQIQFYTLSTNVMQNFKELQDKSDQQQQIFKKLPKEKTFLLGQRKKNLIHLNELTRMLWLNNKDRNKYNLQFFSQWFGVDKSQLTDMLKYLSYLRVPVQQQKAATQDIQFQILKFQI